MSKSKEMYSLDESNERIKERVRQRNMELSASLESSKENLEVSSLSGGGDKSMENTQNETSASKDILMESPLKNRTNSDSNANEPAAESKPTPSRLKSRFSELAAEYENFEVDHNWQHAGSKPKEAYMKGASPRLSIGETRPSVLCTPGGMAQLKSSSTKSPGSRETSPVKQVTTIVCNQTPQKLDAVKEEPRRIHFAHPIAATQIVEYESSMCTTVNTIDESSIVAGCGMHESVDTLPIPATRMFPKNQDGEVDLSSDEYGAHTFKKKTTSEVVKDNDGQVDMSSDEYGAHTFLKKVRSASQAHFSPVHFNRKDFVNELEDEAKKAASGSGGNVPPKSPSWKESMDELNVSHNVSNLIDQAFEFMDKTPNKSAGDATPMKPDRDGVAPHAEEECFSPIKQQPISLPVPPEVYKSPYEEPAVYKSPYEERAVTKSYEETDSAKRDGSSLPYTVSFYRKRIREMRSADTGVEKIDLTTDVATAPIQTIIGSTAHEDQEEDAETRQERKAAMEREVSIQQQRIAQATHALRYCKEQTEFRGSREEGVLEFNYYLSLKDLPPNFVCALEVFGLRTKREHISHEVKYRLTGTLSKKQRSKIPSTLKTSLGGPSALAEPAFQLVGRLTIDINTNGRKLALQDVMTPLEGHVIVKMKKHATEKSNTINRGFLSMYQRTKDGLGTWTRYWCVLEGGEMRFWRSPDEERDGKLLPYIFQQWVVLLDLQTCAGDGASTVRDVCPYPNSFHIDVWVPKEGSRRNSSSGRPELEKLR
ncbi:unnamed protein product [Haemonchus placei]|uniref:Anillin domain-containing protein n=1 Tax=Haemonchus placei TaxID=6290 RepID=A0A158QRD8_HAEPC|nr:unnamed protein product [Haemonchus placei]